MTIRNGLFDSHHDVVVQIFLDFWKQFHACHVSKNMLGRVKVAGQRKVAVKHARPTFEPTIAVILEEFVTCRYVPRRIRCSVVVVCEGSRARIIGSVQTGVIIERMPLVRVEEGEIAVHDAAVPWVEGAHAVAVSLTRHPHDLTLPVNNSPRTEQRLARDCDNKY